MSTIIEEKTDHTVTHHAAHHVPDIHLLTLNCWGLLHISSLRTARLAEIGRQISLMRDPAPPDIVCLQECWTQDDYHAIRQATRSILPHGKFYFAGAFGAGLAILSRWPVEGSGMFRYPLNGRPTAVWRGDWFVGKGVACATIRFGPGEKDLIEVFNTHTHAPYESRRLENDSYLCHRIAQAWEISKLIHAATQRGHLTVALGDFNMLPRSLEHRIITARSTLRDVWRALQPHSSLGPAAHPEELARGVPIPTAEFNIRVNGCTSDGVYNTWRWSKAAQSALRADNPCPVDPNTPDPLGKRLDYIFANTGSSPSSSSASHPSSTSPPNLHGWVVKSASVAMTQRHPDLNVSLSDHFGVFATLTHHHHHHHHNHNHNHNHHQSSSPPSILDSQLLNDPSTDSNHPLPPSTYDEILALTIKYTAREIRQQFWRGIHFYASLVIWIACLVAVWFSPRNFVSFILLLVGSLNLAAGLVDGLLALLFFSSELRALKEFEWEIGNARSLASSSLQET